MVPDKEAGFLLGIRRGIALARQKGEKFVPSSRIIVREVKDELVDWREGVLSINRPSERY